MTTLGHRYSCPASFTHEDTEAEKPTPRVIPLHLESGVSTTNQVRFCAPELVGRNSGGLWGGGIENFRLYIRATRNLDPIHISFTSRIRP